MINHYVKFVKPKTIEIAQEEINLEALKPDGVAGKTLCTLISAGTEINAAFLDVFDWGYPKKAGYAAVFQVEHVGSEVTDIEVGDLVFSMCEHQTYQVCHRRSVIKLPKALQPEHALFARLAGVSMATLSRTSVTPGEKVMVTGLGTVGLMAMFIYSNLGYEVIGVDPDCNRRTTAQDCGFSEVYESVPFDQYKKKIGLALECSGNEAAVADLCQVVRPHGEVSLVGVPWKPYTDLKSYPLLHSVFYNYVKLYSGWEMDLPGQCSEFVHESMSKNYLLAMRLMSEGKINLNGLYTVVPYTDAQKAYENILEKREKKIATIFSY